MPYKSRKDVWRNKLRLNSINKISFKGEFVYDIGASTPAASKKGIECDSFGRPIGEKAIGVVNTKENHFKNSAEFVEMLADRVAEDYKNLDKKGLECLTIFAPGSTIGNKVIKTPNLKDANGNPLTNIDFSQLKKLLQERNVPIAENFKIKLFQDSVGIALSAFEKMFNPQIKDKFIYPGAFHSVISTGGGCGISQILIPDKKRALIIGAGSNYFADETKASRVSDEGASVKATLKEFAKVMGFNPQESEKIVNSGVGQLIQYTDVTVGNKPATKELAKLLEDSGKYIVTESDKEINLKIKPEFTNLHKKAKFKAINKYAGAIARFLPIKLAEGLNKLVLTGPFAFGLNESMKKENTSLPKLILENFKKYNNDEYASIMKEYNFEIICDKPNFEMNDNTECSRLLHFTETCGDRRNWVEVKIKKYQKAMMNENMQATSILKTVKIIISKIVKAIKNMI